MKKQNSVFDKFQEFWKGLDSSEQKDLWDVMTALRGPDMEGNEFITLKLLTTARIRALLIPKPYEVFGFYIIDSLKTAKKAIELRSSLPALSPTQAYRLLTNFNLEHFAKHFRNSLYVLGKRYPKVCKSIAKSVGII